MSQVVGESPETKTATAVVKQIVDTFNLHTNGHARAELILESGLTKVGLTQDEWGEFLSSAEIAGIKKGDQSQAFIAMVKMMGRWGDDGMGDKPTGMSRVVYWFQHIADRFATESEDSSSDEDFVSGGGKPVPPAQPKRIAQTSRKTHQPNETPAEAKSVERANRQSDADDRYHAKHTPPAPVPPHKTHRI